MPRIEIPASGGIREDIDDRVKQPGQWARLENADMTTSGRIRMRAAFAETAATSGGVSRIGEEWALVEESSLVTRSQNAGYAQPATGTLIESGTVPAIPLAWRRAVPGVAGEYGDATAADVRFTWPDATAVVISGEDTLAVFAYPVDRTFGATVVRSVDVVAYSARTGQLVATWQGVLDVGSSSYENAWLQVCSEGDSSTRVVVTVAVQRTAGVALWDIAHNTVDVATGTVGTPGLSVTAVSLAAPRYALNRIDGAPPTLFYVQGTSIAVDTWDSNTGLFVNGGASGTLASEIVSGCVGNNGDRIAVWASAAGSVYAYRAPSGGGFGATRTISTTVNAQRVAVAWISGDIYLIGVTDSGANAGALFYSVDMSTGTVIATSQRIRGASIATAGARFRAAGASSTYLAAIGVILGPSRVAVSQNATPDVGEFAIVGTSDTSALLEMQMLGRGLFGEVKTVGSSSGGAIGCLPNLGASYAPAWACCPPQVESVTAGLQVSPRVVFGSTHRSDSSTDTIGRSAATLDGLTLLGGGKLAWWDGMHVLPSCVPDVPIAEAEVIVSPATWTVGTYSWAVTLEWYDAAGQRYQSPPAVGTITIAAGEIISLTAFSGNIPDNRGAQWVFWITEANGDIYYRLTSVMGYADYTVNATSTSISVGNGGTGPDTTQEILYTVAEPARLTPGCVGPVGAAGRRFWAASGARLYYSHVAEAGEGPQFSVAALYIDLPDVVTGVGELDEQAIVFTARSAYRIVGDGPARNGGGGQFFVQPISGVQGCDDYRSVLSSRVGLWYRSGQSLVLLQRGGGSPADLGHQIQDTLAAYPYVAAAYEDRTESRVFFALSKEPVGANADALVAGVVAVYQYDANVGWALWKPGDGDSGPRAIGQLFGRIAFGDWESGVNLLSDAASTTDVVAGAAAAYTLTAQTGDLRPAGAAAPSQWSAVSLLTGQPSAGTATIATTIRCDTDSGSVTQAATSTNITADRQRARCAPQYASADALQVTWAVTATSAPADLLGATIDVEVQPGTTRVPSARSK